MKKVCKTKNMKRRRTKLPKGSKHKPILALHVLRLAVMERRDTIRQARLETKDVSLLLKENQWNDMLYLVNGIMDITEPLTESMGWRIGDVFTCGAGDFRIDKFESPEIVHGKNIESNKPYMGIVSTCKMHISNLKRYGRKK